VSAARRRRGLAASRRRRLAAGVAGACCAALAACGSGSPLSAGIEGTGAQVAAVSSGTISRFGSIFVNGVEFDTTNATILIDGQTSAAAALSAGEVVDVKGTIAAGGTAGSAAEVAFRVNAEGPIGAVNASSSSLTVLGQTVLVGPQTSLASAAGGSPGFADLTPGTLVAVSGFARADGTIAATRIEIAGAVDAYRITGVVGAVDAAAFQLTINGASVEFGSAALVGFPAGASVQAGEAVEVTGAPGGPSATLAATRIELVSALAAGAGVQGEVEGDITRFASATDFDVAGVHAASSAQTVYLDGTAADLAANVHLSVQGSFDATGTLIAATVQFDQSAPALLKAPVDSVDAATNSLTVLGVAVSTDEETRFEDQSANPVTPFNLSAVAIGDYVEIHGRATGADSIAATLLTREAEAGTVEVRGTAGAVAAPSLRIFGVAAETGASTRFIGTSSAPITSAQFFAAAPGAIVDLQGTVVGGVLQVTTAALASTAELED